jgi:hypothetical protein
MNGVILKTSNSGLNWSALITGTTNDLYEIHFTFTNVGYTVGEGGIILYTVNSGNNWIQLSSGTTNDLHSVYFPSSDTGYAVGNNGTIRKTSNALTVVTPVSNIIPEYFSLMQNYPNPFNPSTKIKFNIPAGNNDNIQLEIFDILGREVRTLVNENLNPGVYEVDFNATELTSGVYFYKLSSGKFVDTKKMIIMK